MDVVEELYRIQKERDVNQLPFLKSNLPALLKREFNQKESGSNSVRRMIYSLSAMINMDEQYRSFILSLLSANINVEGVSGKLVNIVDVLMRTSENSEVCLLLDKVLNSKSYEVKKMLFYYNVVSSIYYVQTEKFRDAIVDYINSEFFKIDYEKLKKHYGNNNGTLHAFPTQYSQAFDFKAFQASFKEDMSNYMEKKLIKEYRLNSIRFITDDQIKSDLVRLYYYCYLDTLYKTRFIKLVKKEIPKLKLDWI